MVMQADSSLVISPAIAREENGEFCVIANPKSGLLTEATGQSVKVMVSRLT